MINPLERAAALAKADTILIDANKTGSRIARMILVNYLKSSYSDSQIAAMLQCSTVTIWKLKKKYLNLQDDKDVVTLSNLFYDTSLTDEEIRAKTIDYSNRKYVYPANMEHIPKSNMTKLKFSPSQIRYTLMKDNNSKLWDVPVPKWTPDNWKNFLILYNN